MTENASVTAPQDASATAVATETVATETVLATEEVSKEVEDLLEALRDVVDPELGVNVVDLGLIYGVDLDENRVATIDMTLTSAACPLTDVIEEQAGEALKDLVADFRINWVWMPPWGPEHITDDGREQLRALGFNI
jgi:metal-sulfur cluster biosynthetic enzyme